MGSQNQIQSLGESSSKKFPACEGRPQAVKYLKHLPLQEPGPVKAVEGANSSEKKATSKAKKGPGRERLPLLGRKKPD